VAVRLLADRDGLTDRLAAALTGDRVGSPPKAKGLAGSVLTDVPKTAIAHNLCLFVSVSKAWNGAGRD
jgi:hypothetical protein